MERRRTWRDHTLRFAQRYGFDDRLRSLRALPNPALRRDLRDHAVLRLIFATALRADAHVIDVGANRGSVLADLVLLTPDGRQMAFEPIPSLASTLGAAFPGVEVEELALSDRAGTSTFAHVVSADGYSGLRRRTLPQGAVVEEISVRTARLDDVLADDFVPALVKIDVEGAELQVLRGARETLARHRPAVIFEHGQGAADAYGTTSGEVWDLFADCGQRIFDLAGVGPYSRDQFAAAFPKPIWNWLAR
jgi:FkbM family methyltransferase